MPATPRGRAKRSNPGEPPDQLLIGAAPLLPPSPPLPLAAGAAPAGSVCASVDSVDPKKECEIAWNGVIRFAGWYVSMRMIRSFSLR